MAVSVAGMALHDWTAVNTAMDGSANGSPDRKRPRPESPESPEPPPEPSPEPSPVIQPGQPDVYGRMLSFSQRRTSHSAPGSGEVEVNFFERTGNLSVIARPDDGREMRIYFEAGRFLGNDADTFVKNVRSAIREAERQKIQDLKGFLESFLKLPLEPKKTPPYRPSRALTFEPKRDSLEISESNDEDDDPDGEDGEDDEDDEDGEDGEDDEDEDDDDEDDDGGGGGGGGGMDVVIGKNGEGFTQFMTP